MYSILIYLFSLTPILIITGPFLSGLSTVIIAIYGIYNFRYFNIIKDNKILKVFLFLFILFSVYIIILSFFSPIPEESYKSSLFYFRFVFFALGSYFLMINFKDKIYKLLLYSLMFSFCIVFTSILIELFCLYFYPKYENDGQLTGIFFSEKIAGSYISRFFPILIGLIYLSNIKIITKHKNNLLIIFFLISLISVLLSGERTSIIIFFLSNLFMIIGLKFYRKVLFNKKSILSILIFLIFFSIFGNRIFDRVIYKTLNQIKDNDGINIFTPHHESHLITAYNMFSENKIFGIGPRMFRFLCDNDKYIHIYDYELQYRNNGTVKFVEGKPLVKYYNGCSTHPHNVLAQIISETGLVGFIFYIYLILFIYFELFKNIFRKKNSYQNIMIIVALASLCSSFFPFIPSNSFFGSYINIFYFFIISIYLSEKK